MLNNNEVVLDYGHGGTDSGACYGNYKEKVWNYDTGKACKNELERHNVIVHETRKGDEYVSLDRRCDIANDTNAKWFVSIHHNAGNGDRGEAIHSILGGEGEDLANCISFELKDLGQTHVKVYDKEGNNGKDYYAVIRGTKMNAVITEVCFMDNTNDNQIADTKTERERNGVAIAHGILDKMGIDIKPGGGKHRYPNGDYNRKAKISGTEDGFLNVRKGRKDFSDGSIIGTFKEGQEITVNYCLDNWFSTWNYNGKEGYISGTYIKIL